MGVARQGMFVRWDDSAAGNARRSHTCSTPSSRGACVYCVGAPVRDLPGNRRGGCILAFAWGLLAVISWMLHCCRPCGAACTAGGVFQIA